jgi:hypothetical protein
MTDVISQIYKPWAAFYRFKSKYSVFKLCVLSEILDISNSLRLLNISGLKLPEWLNCYLNKKKIVIFYIVSNLELIKKDFTTWYLIFTQNFP